MTLGATGPVQFNYTEWSTRYPELAGSVSAALAQLYWQEANLYVDNTGCGPITDTTPGGELDTLLNMVTAHIAFLNAPISPAVSSPTLVGRISNAAQGTVNVAIENQYPPGTPQWYQQTKYGAAYWAATAKYRTMQYHVPWRRTW